MLHGCPLLNNPLCVRDGRDACNAPILGGKGYGSLESLFALPYGVRSLFLAKLALPFLVGFFISCVFIVFNLLWLPSLGLGWTWVVCMVAVTAVSGWVLAFESVTLVGYAMWMMSETAAKWAQMVVMGFYGGAMALLILGVSVSIGALLSVLSAMVVLLGVLCFFALRALSTERIVLNA